MFNKDTDDAPNPDNFATLDDLNEKTEAIMEHVIEHESLLLAAIRALQATDAERSEREASERRHARWPAGSLRSRLWAVACLLWAGTGR